MSIAIANRYARALADVVLEPNSGLDAATAVAQVRDFAAMLESSPELRITLTSPAVSATRKHAVVNRLGDQAGFSRLIRNFLLVVVNHRRIGQFKDIVSGFEAALDERMGRVRAQVSSAKTLTDEQQSAIAARLSEVAGKQVRCEFQVNPELIGGVTARIGSTIYDGSVRGQLDALRRRLIPA